MKPALLFTALFATLAGCSGVSSLTNHSLGLAQTPGEYFRQYLVIAHAECREKQLGPYLVGRNRGNASCDFLFLKPWQPGDSPESTYAHSLKLPPPHDKPKDVYKPGMSPQAYFEALCAAEAREFIFRKVENVEGIVELRPRPSGSSERNRHLTAFEDPATFTHWQFRASQTLTRGDTYRFLETSSGGKRYRFSKAPTSEAFDRTQEAIDAFSARYGFTWRGIADSRQLEHGIAGGEFLIVDRQTNEIVGFKRAFKLRWLGKFPSEQTISVTGFENGLSCPADIAASRIGKYRDFSNFLIDVLVPKTADR